MLIPSIHQRKLWLFFLLMVIVGLNLYFNFSFQGELSERRRSLDEGFAKILLPFQLGVSRVKGGISGGFQYLQELIKAQKENERLLIDLSEMKLKVQLYEEVSLENERLKKMLEFRNQEAAQSLSARVIGKDPSLTAQSLILDRGEDDGVRLGMPVISVDGVVGRIVQVTAWSSRVLLITDVNSRVDVVVRRSRARAIASGSLRGGLSLRFLPRRQDLEKGDVLVTSGMAGIFPPGFLVGKVDSVSSDPNLVLDDAELEPAVNFNALEEVFIVKSAKTQKG